MLLLLVENALCRPDVFSCNVEAFDAGERTLRIIIKRQGTRETRITLSPSGAAAEQPNPTFTDAIKNRDDRWSPHLSRRADCSELVRTAESRVAVPLFLRY